MRYQGIKINLSKKDYLFFYLIKTHK